MSAETPLTCPVCDAATHALVFNSANGYPIVRCSACSLVYTDARRAPPPSELYPAFDQSEDVGTKSIRASAGVFLKKRMGIVQSAVKSGRLLDYGCGNGAFARAMSQNGFEAVGLEPFSLGKPTEDGKLTLIREPLESAAPRLGQFDAITMWHVLEHVPRPAELLRQLVKLLTPNGALIISVPNFASVQSAWFKDSWFHLDPPRHLIHFEDATLRQCLNKAGLSVVNEVPFVPEYGSSGWIQSSLNRVLPHKNYLYELVKDRGALRSMPKASSAMHLAVSLAAGAPIFALSIPVEAFASAKNRGGALTVVAKRG